MAQPKLLVYYETVKPHPIPLEPPILLLQLFLQVIAYTHYQSLKRKSVSLCRHLDSSPQLPTLPVLRSSLSLDMFIGR